MSGAESADPVHPGEFLAATMEALGITQAEVARRSGFTTKHVNRIVNGRAGYSAEAAGRLGRTLDIPPELLIELQTAYTKRAEPSSVALYILDANGEPRRLPGHFAEAFPVWAAKYGPHRKGARLIARDELGTIVVTTTFLGYAYGKADQRRPHLFETIAVFDHQDVEARIRYPTRELALVGHRRMFGLLSGES